MRKLLVFAIVLVVFIGVLAVVLMNLEGIVNKNKNFILSRAEATLGRTVSIGNIGITLRGGIGVRLEDFSVADDPAFSDKPFVEASGLQVNAKLLPLLKKEFQVKRVILRDPLIRVIRNENGELNIGTLAKNNAGEEPSSSGGSFQTATGAAAVPLIVSLATIDGGEIQYVDRVLDVELRVTQIETSVRDLDLEKPISMELEAAVLSDERNLTVRGTFGPLPGDGADPAAIPIDTRLDLDALESTALFETLPALAKAIPPDVQIGGPVTLRLGAKGTLSDLNLALGLDGTHLDIRGPQDVRKPPGVALVADADVRSTMEKLAINSATVTFGPLEARIDGEVVFGEPPSVALNVSSTAINLSGWESFVPMVEPYHLSGKAELSAHIEGTLQPGKVPAIRGTATIVDATAAVPQFLQPITDVRSEISFAHDRAELGRFSFRTGESRIEGNATIEKFAPLTVSYKATSPSFMLADIRPPQPNVKKPEVLEQVTVTGRMTVDDEPRGEGKVSSPSGSIANVDYRNLSAVFSMEGKTINISSMSANALRGEIAGQGRITVGEQSNAFDIQVDARKVDVTEFLTALPASVRRALHGTANLSCNISGSGREWEDMQTTLNGAGLAEIFDGEIFEINIANAILDEVGRFAGSSDLISNQLRQKYPKVFEDRNTEFTNLKSDFVVENGRLRARNLLLKHDDYQITGKGSIGLERDLDLTTNFIVSKRLTDDLISQYKAVSYLTNPQGLLEIPVVLTGTLPNVHAKPDADYIKKIAGNALVEDGIDRLKKKYLKDLFPSKKESDSKADTTRFR